MKVQLWDVKLRSQYRPVQTQQKPQEHKEPVLTSSRYSSSDTDRTKLSGTEGIPMTPALVSLMLKCSAMLKHVLRVAVAVSARMQRTFIFVVKILKSRGIKQVK